jgi:hypothetical protein
VTEICVLKQYWLISMLSLQKQGLRCKASQESTKVCSFGTAVDYLFKIEDDIKLY